MNEAKQAARNILLVDDEALVRGAARMLLNLRGHHVTEAADGLEALALYEPHRFDLVITDFHMPRLKGNQLAVEIKRRSPAQPILMITAHAARLGNAENPVDGILAKPYTIRDLDLEIERLTDPGDD